VAIYQLTWHNIPEHMDLQQHNCEDLKSHMEILSANHHSYQGVLH